VGKVQAEGGGQVGVDAPVLAVLEVAFGGEVVGFACEGGEGVGGKLLHPVGGVGGGGLLVEGVDEVERGGGGVAELQLLYHRVGL
jgi:hypothetical protein